MLNFSKGLEESTALGDLALWGHLSEPTGNPPISSLALKSLFAVSEAYPDLKANENFLELQRELTDTENKIQAARRFFNTNVMTYNTALQVFPSNMIASIFKFKDSEFFELEEDEKEAAQDPVEVKF